MYRPPGAADREFWIYFTAFLVSKLVRMGPNNPQDSFGPSFRPNRRLSTRFLSNLMLLAPTGTLNRSWNYYVIRDQPLLDFPANGCIPHMDLGILSHMAT